MGFDKLLLSYPVFRNSMVFKDIYQNSICNWIKCLKKSKFISAKYDKDDKGRKIRKIYPTSKCGSAHKKLWRAHTKNYDYNNKIINKSKVII